MDVLHIVYIHVLQRGCSVNSGLPIVCTFTVDILEKEETADRPITVYSVMCQFACLYILTQTYSHFNLLCS